MLRCTKIFCVISLVAFLQISFADQVPCGHLVQQQITYMDTLQQHDVTRNYFLYLPERYCAEAAHNEGTVIALHGYQTTATGMALNSMQGSFNRLANRRGVIMAYPQGFTMVNNSVFYSSWNYLSPQYYTPNSQSDYSVVDSKNPVCNISAMGSKNPIPQQPGCNTWNSICGWTSCYDDVSYILAVQSDIESRFGADPNKQYIIGFSNGADMVYRMTCQYPEKFKAAVAIAGTTSKGMLCYDQSKNSTNPNWQKGTTSLLILSGVDDHTDPLTAAQQAASPSSYWYYEFMDDLSARWSSEMNCAASQDISMPNVLDGTTCHQYSQCDDPQAGAGVKDNQVVYCSWGNTGTSMPSRAHVYPGGIYGGGHCVGPSQAASLQSANLPACPIMNPSDDVQGGTDFIYSFLINNS